MKFSNGCWLMAEGVNCFSPTRVYFSDVEDKKVTLFLPTMRVQTRGDTLGGVCITAEITSPMPGVLRLCAWHDKGRIDNEPKFDLNIGESERLDTKESEDELAIASGSLSLVIDKNDWSMTYYSGGKKRCVSAKKDLAYMRTDYRGDAYVKVTDDGAYMQQALSLGVGENIYGLGERFSAFVKNGQSIDVWNEDGGTSTMQSYKNIPFYISNKGYGVFVNSTGRVSFEVASDAVNKVQFSVQGEKIDYFFIDGPAMKDVLKKYTDLTGKPGLPAPWTFGLWLSTSFTTSYDEATVMSFIDGMQGRGIPLKVFHFDSFWMKDFHWCDLTWDSRVFPDPKGMLSRIKAKGLRICVWINPYIAQASRLFDEGMENGYFLKRPDGGVWQWDMWQPGMAIVDFTNPRACEWYKGKLSALMDMGVDCFKTDFGERIPTDCVYYDGSCPEKMHNYYSYIYNRTVYELLEEKRGKGEAVLFARSATAGGQKFPVHWGGDCWSDYESMEESIRGGLSLQLSGFGFWSHDIGGFEHTSTADVYKRWAAFGLLSSHSRLHGSSSYRVPWVYDDEAVDVVRFFTRLKAELMPYIWRTALTAHTEGIPSMRAMVLEFPEDKNCCYLDKQYMLGDSLLVAPVFNDEGIGEAYLPCDGGVWTDFFTGKEYGGGDDGGIWVKRGYGYCEIPLFVRPNSIIALGASSDGPEYDYAEDVTLAVYGLSGEAKTEVFGMDKNKALAIRAFREQDNINIEIDNPENKKLTVVLKNIAAKSAEGAKLDNGSGVRFASGSDSVLTGCGSRITCYGCFPM